jgi:FkbM family methyltransferase
MKKLISWVLLNSEGVTLSDKLILFFIKIFYLGSRVTLRIVLGKRRRDKIYSERDLDFGSFWNRFYLFWNRGKKKSALLRFKTPKYKFEFYCRNNKDDFKIMTFHEDDILEHFALKEGDVVVDVGAHIGPYTIIASKRVGPNGKVVAIEADPDNFNILTRNIHLNKLTNVVALNYAVYSREEKIKLYLPSGGKFHESYTKFNTIMSDRAPGEGKFVEVAANTLDSLLQSNQIKQEDVNWIKIDVEGAEYEVLKGAEGTLSNSKDIALLIEVHNLSSGTNLYESISKFLGPYNFKIEFEKKYESGERHIIARKH